MSTYYTKNKDNYRIKLKVLFMGLYHLTGYTKIPNYADDNNT